MVSTIQQVKIAIYLTAKPSIGLEKIENDIRDSEKR
jgi:hypothetical protein